MIDKKPFRVTNQQLKILSNQCDNLCETCIAREHCREGGVEELALDLLDSRELIDKQEAIIKEMREVIKNIKQDFQPGYHDCTDDGLPQCSWCDGDDILDKTKDYAE